MRAFRAQLREQDRRRRAPARPAGSESILMPNQVQSAAEQFAAVDAPQAARR